MSEILMIKLSSRPLHLQTWPQPSLSLWAFPCGTKPGGSWGGKIYSEQQCCTRETNATLYWVGQKFPNTLTHFLANLIHQPYSKKERNEKDNHFVVGNHSLGCKRVEGEENSIYLIFYSVPSTLLDPYKDDIFLGKNLEEPKKNNKRVLKINISDLREI